MVATTFWRPDGKPMSAAQFLKSLFGTLPDFFNDEDQLREIWSVPETRSALLAGLADTGLRPRGPRRDAAHHRGGGLGPVRRARVRGVRVAADRPRGARRLRHGARSTRRSLTSSRRSWSSCSRTTCRRASTSSPREAHGTAAPDVPQRAGRRGDRARRAGGDQADVLGVPALPVPGHGSAHVSTACRTSPSWPGGRVSFARV